MTPDGVRSRPDAHAPGDAVAGRVLAPKAIPVRHPGRWVAAAAVLVVAAMAVHWLSTTPEFEWHVVWSYMFDPAILRGVRLTIELTAIAMVGGIVLGMIFAVMRLSENPIVSAAAWLYIWFFRGTPVLVQLFFWYNLPTVLHSVSVGIPFGPSWFHSDPKTLVTQLAAACLGLGLNEGAYMAEIVRAGIVSVDQGQTEAAEALGMSRTTIMTRIVLPQAMRVIIPPTGNETISMLKNTAQASVIGVTELLYTAQIIYARNFETVPLLITVSCWYLFMTSLLSIGQSYLERHFSRGVSPGQRARRPRRGRPA